VVLGRQERVTLRDLPASVRNYHPAVADADTVDGAMVRGNLTVAEAEKQLIIRALQDCQGNRTEAARKLGMSRRTLHRKLHTYHLEGF
jgi:transcriptional regulator of acetoin/glycerol metabolism